MDSELNIWSDGLPLGVAEVVIIAGDYQRNTKSRLVTNQTPFLLIRALGELGTQDPVAAAAAYRIFFGMNLPPPHETTELVARLGRDVVELILEVINPYYLEMQDEEDAAWIYFYDLRLMGAEAQTTVALVELAELMNLAHMIGNFPDENKSEFWKFVSQRPEFINWYYLELINSLTRVDERVVGLIRINHKYIEQTMVRSE